ncbi:hypothetical protein HY311_00460 [Candidatus Nomurabacteria bacterium]|nr:hypothetical protein [Candidatus Nomurabacteria bacterium]
MDNQQLPPNFITPKPKHWKKFILILVLVAILAGASWYAFKYFSKPKTNNAVVAPVVNQEGVPAAPVVQTENPDVAKVKVALEGMSAGFLAGDKTVIAKYASLETSKLILDSKTKTVPVTSFIVDSVSQLDQNNIVATITTKGGPANQKPTQNIVFIQEGGDWKYDMKASLDYGIKSPAPTTKIKSSAPANSQNTNAPLQIVSMSATPSAQLTYPFSGNTLNVVLKNNTAKTINAYLYRFYLDENNNLDNYNGMDASGVSIVSGGIFTMKSFDTKDAVGDALKRSCDLTGMAGGQYHLHLKISPAVTGDSPQGIETTDTGILISEMSMPFTITASCSKKTI